MTSPSRPPPGHTVARHGAERSGCASRFVMSALSDGRPWPRGPCEWGRRTGHRRRASRPRGALEMPRPAFVEPRADCAQRVGHHALMRYRMVRVDTSQLQQDSCTTTLCAAEQEPNVRPRFTRSWRGEGGAVVRVILADARSLMPCRRMATEFDHDSYELSRAGLVVTAVHPAPRATPVHSW